MFIELMPHLGERTVMLTVARISGHQRKWTAKRRGISGCTLRKICGSDARWKRRRQRWTPRRRPHVSRPAGALLALYILLKVRTDRQIEQRRFSDEITAAPKGYLSACRLLAS
jgi:hypothetical protein